MKISIYKRVLSTVCGILLPLALKCQTLDFSIIKSVDSFPASLPIRDSGPTDYGTLIPIETVQKNLIPVLNITEHINRWRQCDKISYYAICQFNGQNGRFLIYLGQSTSEINVMLADISDETTFPRTLVIQRYTTEHNIETRIFYNYNKENNCIEINTISQFADNKPICLQEYYSIERGFPYKGNKTYEYTDYPDEEHIFTPLDESKWIEISMNPELRIHTE